MLGPDPLVLVVARGHAWAGRSSVRFGEVAQLEWIAGGQQGALSTYLLFRAAAAGVTLVPKFSYPEARGVLQLVAQGLGVTVLPKAVVDQHAGIDSVACIPLEDRWAARRLLACCRDDGHAVRRTLVEQIVRHWPATS